MLEVAKHIWCKVLCTVTIETPMGLVHLKRTLYVPTLKTNVLSALTATKNGGVFVGKGSLIELKRQDRVCLTAECKQGVPIVNGVLQVAAKSKSVIESGLCAAIGAARAKADADTWHRRLGHSSDGAWAQLQRDSSFPDDVILPSTQEKISSASTNCLWDLCALIAIQCTCPRDFKIS
jgi:hypothetical protein